MSRNSRRLLEQALLFIGKNLDKNLFIGDIACHAHMSEYHFQRVFSTYMGETVKQYVLHRRLESAAERLVCQQDIKIIDIAVGSGFGDPSYFSRAFKKHYDVTPVDFRAGLNEKVTGCDTGRPFLKTISSKHKTTEVKIETHPTLWFNNKQTAMNKRDENYHGDKLLKIQDDFNEIFDLQNPDIFGIASHCGCDDHTVPQSCADQVTTMSHGAIYRQKHADEWCSDWLKIEAGTWAVMNHSGNYNFEYQTFNKVIRSWLPGSGYELRNSMNFEVHRKNPSSPGLEELITQIYIPIKEVK